MKAVIKKHKLVNGGKFSKSLRIYSNAENNPSLRLEITGVVLTPISTPKRFIRIESSANGTAKTLFSIFSKKEDLKILSVEFDEQRGSANSVDNASSPLKVKAKLKLTKTSTKDENGYLKYNIELTLPIAPTKISSGNFIFTSNHPEEKVFNIRGMILPPPSDK